ncbi:hypothetical protein EVAR_8003_1 [Eumeta japonica]|uniref:Uncharacterized protein n=1 Tax=Eumeta variegata TaxID=151549 RepID=A0A4C1TJL2_EUMVA|nr:hypothetical protein EVAR_8003_1 [Eumeta japonica]
MAGYGRSNVAAATPATSGFDLRQAVRNGIVTGDEFVIINNHNIPPPFCWYCKQCLSYAQKKYLESTGILGGDCEHLHTLTTGLSSPRSESRSASAMAYAGTGSRFFTRILAAWRRLRHDPAPAGTHSRTADGARRGRSAST